MATQLTRRPFLSSLRGDAPVLNMPLRYMVALAAGAVAFAYASLFAAIYNAQRNEAGADQRYADTRTIIEAPPADLDAPTRELTAASDALERARINMQPPSIDPASDEMTTLLVTRAQASGLAVASVERIDPAQAKIESTAYDVQALRLTVDGAPDQLRNFLAGMHEVEPALIATLTSMRFDDAGQAQSEILFSVYARAAEPTPTTPGARP